MRYKHFFLFSSLLIISCSLFDPRDPQDPSGGGAVWQTPTSPDLVVENMQSSLNGKSVQYLACLDDKFFFFADTNDVDDYPTLNFTDWDKSIENLTVSQLFSIVPEDSTIIAEFLPVPGSPDPVAPEDSATLYRNYSISIPGAEYNPAFGIAEFRMIEDDNGLWWVSEWHDNRFEPSSTVKTWAVVKAVYR
ncbi:hypothetical protein CSA37_04420 [Candidatus Fermentibacteria bacterium]|nr:MAG: hypothetical protein CSA37_04420 [Candidatus Fermentibacteria bacterium]